MYLGQRVLLLVDPFIDCQMFSSYVCFQQNTAESII